MTRTHKDKKYKFRNDLSAKRNSFRQISAVRWLRANMPHVMKAIDREADKLWPLLRRNGSGQSTHNDYSFILKLKARP